MLDYEKSHNILIGLNKPRGVICTHNDEKGRVRVYDLIPKNILKDFKEKIWEPLSELLDLNCAFVKYIDYMGCVKNWPGVFRKTKCKTCGL